MRKPSAKASPVQPQKVHPGKGRWHTREPPFTRAGGGLRAELGAASVKGLGGMGGQEMTGKSWLLAFGLTRVAAQGDLAVTVCGRSPLGWTSGLFVGPPVSLRVADVTTPVHLRGPRGRPTPPSTAEGKCLSRTCPGAVSLGAQYW